MLFSFKLFTAIVEKPYSLLQQLMQPDVKALIELHVDQIHSVWQAVSRSERLKKLLKPFIIFRGSR